MKSRHVPLGASKVFRRMGIQLSWRMFINLLNRRNFCRMLRLCTRNTMNILKNFLIDEFRQFNGQSLVAKAHFKIGRVSPANNSGLIHEVRFDAKGLDPVANNARFNNFLFTIGIPSVHSRVTTRIHEVGPVTVGFSGGLLSFLQSSPLTPPVPSPPCPHVRQSGLRPRYPRPGPPNAGPWR
jgi:hypothetical protein